MQAIGAYFFRQLQVERADVVGMTDVFGLSVESLLARLDVTVIARLAVAQIKLLCVFWQFAEIVQVRISRFQLKEEIPT